MVPSLGTTPVVTADEQRLSVCVRFVCLQLQNPRNFPKPKWYRCKVEASGRWLRSKSLTECLTFCRQSCVIQLGVEGARSRTGTQPTLARNTANLPAGQNSNFAARLIGLSLAQSQESAFRLSKRHVFTVCQRAPSAQTSTKSELATANSTQQI